jgi:hypothetical protein
VILLYGPDLGRDPERTLLERRLALRPVLPWPFARAGAENLVTAETEERVAECLADALGEVMGRPRWLVFELVEQFGISFARNRYAATVAVEAGRGLLRRDGRRYTPGAVFFRLSRELLGTRWEELFQPPNEKSLRDAARVALERVVPLWRGAPAAMMIACGATSLSLMDERERHDTMHQKPRGEIARTLGDRSASSRSNPEGSPSGIEITDPQTILDAAGVEDAAPRTRKRRRSASKGKSPEGQHLLGLARRAAE